MRRFYIKKSLNANAYVLSTARTKFAEKLPHVHEHIIKLILMPDVQPTTHWKKEIAVSLNSISKLKGRGYPTAKMLFEWSYLSYKDELDNLGKLTRMVRQIKNEYSDLPMIEINLPDLQQKVKAVMEEYLSWLCKLLPVDGFVESQLCVKKLTELLD